MRITCKHCGCSGKYIDYTGEQMQNSGSVTPGYAIVDCKYCKGTGYIDEDEIISVPRRFVKDEYFNDQMYK